MWRNECTSVCPHLNHEFLLNQNLVSREATHDWTGQSTLTARSEIHVQSKAWGPDKYARSIPWAKVTNHHVSEKRNSFENAWWASWLPRLYLFLARPGFDTAACKLISPDLIWQEWHGENQKRSRSPFSFKDSSHLELQNLAGFKERRTVWLFLHKKLTFVQLDDHLQHYSSIYARNVKSAYLSFDFTICKVNSAHLTRGYVISREQWARQRHGINSNQIVCFARGGGGEQFNHSEEAGTTRFRVASMQSCPLGGEEPPENYFTKTRRESRNLNFSRRNPHSLPSHNILLKSRFLCSLFGIRAVAPSLRIAKIEWDAVGDFPVLRDR